MSESLVVAVTGSSRGVGKGLVELLAKQQLGRSLIIYATSRSGDDANIQAATGNEVRYRKLDITCRSSIESFFHSARSEETTIDVLINNAAVSNDHRETASLAAETIHNNYGGTRDMCKAFLSQANLKPGSRLVNVTSGYNPLDNYRPNIQDAFRKATEMSDLDELAGAYLEAVAEGQAAQQAGGWGAGPRSYKVSKALINSLTILLARQHPETLVNCCCPGWCDTDMGNQAKGVPPKTPEEGARIPARLAIGNLGQQGDENGGLGQSSEKISGHFFENDSIIERGWGKAKLWLESYSRVAKVCVQ